MTTHLNADYRTASKLAEAIYEHFEYYGIGEIEPVTDLLTGETSIEDFIKEVECDLAERKQS